MLEIFSKRCTLVSARSAQDVIGRLSLVTKTRRGLFMDFGNNKLFMMEKRA